MKPNQLQDFVDVLPQILKATAGMEINFRLAVEIRGKERPADKTIVEVNKLLEGVEKNLRIQ